MAASGRLFGCVFRLEVTIPFEQNAGLEKELRFKTTPSLQTWCVE